MSVQAECYRALHFCKKEASIMLKILLAIIAVLLLVAGGLQGYLWYQTKAKVEQLTSMIYPVLSLNYRSVHASLFGSVGLNDVTLTPVGSSDTFNIDTIRVNSSDILDLYTIKSKLEVGEIPESLSLSFNNFRASLYSDFMLQSKSNLPFGPFATRACGDIQFIGPEQLEAMGYNAFEGDFEIGYDFDATSGSFKIRLNYDFRDMMAISMEVVFAVSHSPTLAAFWSESPKLSYAELVLADQSYQDRKKEFCAEQSNTTPEEFVLAHLGQLQQTLNNSGVSLGPELIEGYKRFLHNPGRINISINPGFPLNPAELQFYKPSDIVKLLNIQMQFNDTPVNNLAIDFVPSRPAVTNADEQAIASQRRIPVYPVTETAALEDDETRTATETAPAAIETVVAQQAFNPTPVSELHRHVGKSVRIKITNGRLYQGKINDVTDESLNIITRLSGGTATFFVPFDRIDEVSVLY